MQRNAEAIGHFFHHNQYAKTREAGLLSALRVGDIITIHNLFAEVRGFVARAEKDFYEHRSESEYKLNPNFRVEKWIQGAQPLRQRFEALYRSIQERYGAENIEPC